MESAFRTNSVLPLAFLLALNGILFEYLFAQYITAVLGGGYGVLFFVFCLFASFLGVGAVCAANVSVKYRHPKFLASLQVFLLLLLSLIPSWYSYLNSAYLNSPDSSLILIGAFFPAAMVGLVTGFEIPFIYAFARVSIGKVLFFDYLGMFGGILLFPFLTLHWVGFENMVYLLGSIAVVAAILAFIVEPPMEASLLKAEQDHKDDVIKNERAIPPSIFYALAFLLSFYSFAYQGLIGKIIVSVVSDRSIVAGYGVGFYIFGMAVGAFFADKGVEKSQQAYEWLVKNEICICIAVCLTPIALYLFFGIFALLEGTLLRVSELEFLFVGIGVSSLFPLVVGIFSGMELPLILKWAGYASEDRKGLYVIAFNYLAALFSGLFVGFYLTRWIAAPLALLGVVGLNFLTLLYLVKLKTPRLSRKSLVWILSIVLVMSGYSFFIPKARQFYLDSYYSKIGLSDWSWESVKAARKFIEQSGITWRYESFFQNIDVRLNLGQSIEGQSESMALYLNKQPQFSSSTIENYHMSMIYASKSFVLKDPERILILGGGDGLLASRVLAVYPQAEVYLVELDQAIVELAKTNSFIKQYNSSVFENKRLKVLIGDGYQFVRTSADTFDLVFVDFPYPTSFDLTRLYSLEFYSGLRRILRPQGVAVIDAPLIIDIGKNMQKVPNPLVFKLLNTLYAAGFEAPFAFGPYDPFLAVSKDNRSLKFQEEILKNAENSVFTNLFSLESSLGEWSPEPDLVHSVLRPRIGEL